MEQSETPWDHRGQTEVLQGLGQSLPPQLGVLTCTHALHLHSLRMASCWAASSTGGSSFCTRWMGFSSVGSVCSNLPSRPGPQGWPHPFLGLSVSQEGSGWRGSANASGLCMTSQGQGMCPQGLVLVCGLKSLLYPSTPLVQAPEAGRRSRGLSRRCPGMPG